MFCNVGFAGDAIDGIFGVKLNDDVSEYAKIENAETDDWLPNIYSFYENKITGHYFNIEKDSTFDEYYLRTDENYKVISVNAIKYTEHSYNDLFSNNCKEEKKRFISDLSNTLDINPNDFYEYFSKNKKGEKYLWHAATYTYKDNGQEFRLTVMCNYWRPIDPSFSKILSDLSVNWVTEDYYRTSVMPRVKLIEPFNNNFIKKFLKN